MEEASKSSYSLLSKLKRTPFLGKWFEDDIKQQEEVEPTFKALSHSSNVPDANHKIADDVGKAETICYVPMISAGSPSIYNENADGLSQEKDIKRLNYLHASQAPTPIFKNTSKKEMKKKEDQPKSNNPHNLSDNQGEVYSDNDRLFKKIFDLPEKKSCTSTDFEAACTISSYDVENDRVSVQSELQANDSASNYRLNRCVFLTKSSKDLDKIEASEHNIKKPENPFVLPCDCYEQEQLCASPKKSTTSILDIDESLPNAQLAVKKTSSFAKDIHYENQNFTEYPDQNVIHNKKITADCKMQQSEEFAFDKNIVQADFHNLNQEQSLLTVWDNSQPQAPLLSYGPKSITFSSKSHSSKADGSRFNDRNSSLRNKLSAAFVLSSSSESLNFNNNAPIDSTWSSRTRNTDPSTNPGFQIFESSDKKSISKGSNSNSENAVSLEGLSNNLASLKNKITNLFTSDDEAFNEKSDTDYLTSNTNKKRTKKRKKVGPCREGKCCAKNDPNSSCQSKSISKSRGSSPSRVGPSAPGDNYKWMPDYELNPETALPDVGLSSSGVELIKRESLEYISNQKTIDLVKKPKCILQNKCTRPCRDNICRENSSAISNNPSLGSTDRGVDYLRNLGENISSTAPSKAMSVFKFFRNKFRDFGLNKNALSVTSSIHQHRFPTSTEEDVDDFVTEIAVNENTYPSSEFGKHQLNLQNEERRHDSSGPILVNKSKTLAPTKGPSSIISNNSQFSRKSAARKFLRISDTSIASFMANDIDNLGPLGFIEEPKKSLSDLNQVTNVRPSRSITSQGPSSVVRAPSYLKDKKRLLDKTIFTRTTSAQCVSTLSPEVCCGHKPTRHSSRYTRPSTEAPTYILKQPKQPQEPHMTCEERLVEEIDHEWTHKKILLVMLFINLAFVVTAVVIENYLIATYMTMFKVVTDMQKAYADWKKDYLIE